MSEPEERMPGDILIVDDHAETRLFLTDLLGREGIPVRCVASGEEAVAQARLSEPDAVLLDVLMPGMTGFQVCEALRRISAHVPIIFMTGLGETEHIVHGFEVGANDYVSKPIAAAELLARLRAHTRIASLARATRQAVNQAPMPLLAIAGRQILWANQAAARLIGGGRPGGLNGECRLREMPMPSGSGGVRFAVTTATGEFEARRISESGQGVSVFSIGPFAQHPRLTDREGEVLLWVARGKTNRDIADILRVSPRTVNKHLEHIFEKLGVETRTAAAAVARNLEISGF